MAPAEKIEDGQTKLADYARIGIARSAERAKALH
jgi:hypothetical protein